MPDINTSTLGPAPSTEPQLEYARADQVQRLTGIKRSTLYRLLKAGSIKGAKLPVTGAKSGVRVFDMASIRAFINKQM